MTVTEVKEQARARAEQEEGARWYGLPMPHRQPNSPRTPPQATRLTELANRQEPPDG